MSVYFVTGKLGGGKSLVSIGRIRDYLLKGKKVATNLDLNLEYLLPKDFKCKNPIYRVPDKPSADDLHALGYGATSKNDHEFGLLVLDELGTWLNSRNYQKDADRQGVIDWFLHARKFRWDLILIVQDIELIDKQVRISLCEHLCICRRTDRIPLPFVSFIIKTLTGWQPKLPRMHVGSVFYGSGSNAIKVDTWVYRGNDLFRCYDSFQIFEDNENRLAQFLPPSHLKPRNNTLKNHRYIMRITKIYFKKMRIPLVFLAGLACNFVLLFGLTMYNNVKAGEEIKTDIAEQTTVEKQEVEIKEETERIQLSYVTTKGRYNETITYFYNGKMYYDINLPYPVYWVKGKPYMDIPLDSEDKNLIAKNDNTSESSL